MKAKLLISAASAILLGSGGMTLAQMQGGNEGQNMNQQMQQMQEQNPHMQKHNPGEEQAAPEEGQQNQQPGAAPEERHDNTGTEERGHSTTQAKTLTTDQKTQLRRSVIMRRDAPRVENVNFTVRVGVAVPRSIRVVPVPQEIVAIYPEWNGFLYFVDGDEIIVVDPYSYAIVGVLEA